MEIIDTEETKLKEVWAFGDYIEECCNNCKRQRLCVCENGKHRCEKCNWVQEDNDYCEVAI